MIEEIDQRENSQDENKASDLNVIDDNLQSLVSKVNIFGKRHN